MDMYKEILINVLAKEKAEVYFPQMQIPAEKIVEMQCYKALCRIREILEDDSNSDTECFMKIENIVCTLEDLGCPALGRHDW